MALCRCPRPYRASRPVCNAPPGRSSGVFTTSRRCVSVRRRSDVVDLPEKDLAEHRARCPYRVRHIGDVDTHASEVGLQPLAPRRALPVVALDDDVEPEALPHLEVARDVLGDGLIDEADAA